MFSIIDKNLKAITLSFSYKFNLNRRNLYDRNLGLGAAYFSGRLAGMIAPQIVFLVSVNDRGNNEQ